MGRDEPDHAQKKNRRALTLGIRHNVLSYSDDYEVLEITLPADYETVQVED